MSLLFLPRAALAAALLALAACGDPSRPISVELPPQPATPRANLATEPACARTDAQFLQQQINSLFADGQLRRKARDWEGKLEAQCSARQSATRQPLPHPNVATNAAMDYLQFLLESRASKTASNPAYWAYAMRVFQYVGYTLPSNAGVLESTGFVGICSSRALADCDGIAQDGHRGIKIFQGALVKDTDAPTANVRYVLTLFAVDCRSAYPKLPGANAYVLPNTGLCADVSVDPKSTASFDFAFDRGVLVEVCTTNDAPAYVYTPMTDPYGGGVSTQGKLGQRSPSFASPSGYRPVSLRPRPSQTILNPAACKSGTTSGAQSFGSLSRWSESLASLLLPRRAFASHGGLGTLPGFADDLSIFGGFDSYLFNATFDKDVVGSYPQAGEAQKELRGTWNPALGPNPSPSVVTVQATSALFGSQYALLNQAGGNAAAKPALTFTGVLPFAATAFEADQTVTYRVRFRAAVLSPRAQNAELLLLTATGDSIGRFVFTDGSSSQAGAVAFKTPGDSATTSVAGGWARNQVKSFEAILQFSNGASGALNAVSVQLGFLGDPRASHTFASTALPPSLTAVQWKLDNKDGAIVAFDDLQVFIEPAP